MLINVKMPTNCWHFNIYETLCSVEHEKSFIISASDQTNVGLILIQTVGHSDGIPERFFFFRKVDIEKICRRQKSMNNYPEVKVNLIQHRERKGSVVECLTQD